MSVYAWWRYIVRFYATMAVYTLCDFGMRFMGRIAGGFDG